MRSNLLQRALRAIVVAFGLAMSTGMATATEVEATFENQSGNTWSVSFVVRNDGVAVPVKLIESLSIYFPVSGASNLTLLTTPADWDVLAIQPDAGLGSDGLLDLLWVGAGAAPAEGESFGGLTAMFDWTGAVAPSALGWSVNDPVSFAVMDQGSTVAGTPVSAVPEPSTYVLLATGLVAVGVARRRRREARQPMVNASTF